jgi:hypothetical protein
MACPEDFENVERRIDRVLTQYRESPKLLHLIRTMLRQVEIVQQAVCDLPAWFDIDTAVGDQLTIIGKRLGFPRDHCVCAVQPAFGFDCGPQTFGFDVLGFCTDAAWIECADFGVSEISIDDDELYRKFLKVRRYQMLAYFDLASLTAALRIFWGDTAKVLDRGRGRVVLAPGRPLTAAEEAVLQLYPRVMPVGLGIAQRYHFGPVRVFGFGEGWGGFCDGEAVDGQPLLTEDDEPILTEAGDEILTDNLGIGSDWMCEIDVRPYDC